MTTCNYVFPHTTKNHQKGSICGSYIRKKDCEMCWQHQKKPTIQDDNKVVQLSESEEKEKEIEFIQLENSSKK